MIWNVRTGHDYYMHYSYHDMIWNVCTGHDMTHTGTVMIRHAWYEMYSYWSKILYDCDMICSDHDMRCTCHDVTCTGNDMIFTGHTHP